MRRPTPPGTPARSSRYLTPFDAGRLFRRSLAAAGALLVVSVALYSAGLHRLASPGTLAAPHGGIDVQCTQCHQPAKQAIDLRCERCHDPIDSRRFESPAHAARTGARATLAAYVPQVACSTCHVDHAGRRRDLKRVEDARCTSCHAFSSFDDHPEFALVRAVHDIGAGIKFSHEIHLREIAKTGGDRCQSCHTPTRDQRAFEPIVFDTQCAKCHLLDGALTLTGKDPLKSGWTLAAALPPARPSTPAPERSAADERGRVTLERFTHRDPWTIAVADRLTRMIAGGALALAGARRGDEIARLTSLTLAVPLTALTDADLAAWLQLLDRDVASLARAVAAGPSASADPTAGLDAIARLDPSIPTLLTQLRAARRRGSNMAVAIDPRSLDDRRREIASLLAAVSARAAGSPAAAQAAALEKRLADVKAPAPSSASANAAPMEERLGSIEEAVRTIEAGAGATAATDIRVMADRTRQQALGGADQGAIAGARSRILERLDALEARAAAPLRARIADLRETMLLVASGGDLGPLRDRKTRLRDRVVLERRLRTEHGAVAVDAAVNRERLLARQERDTRRLQIATPAVTLPPLADLEPARAKTALRGLLGACLACHRLDTDGAAMRPVSSARSMLTAATFSHKPHLVQACDTCHAVATSGAGEDDKGEDVNLPRVKSCATCHDSARARAECVSCHLYHPQSAAELVRAMR